jgi:hypothetical protein
VCYESGGIFDKAIMTSFKVISRLLLGIAEENTADLSQYNASRTVIPISVFPAGSEDVVCSKRWFGVSKFK